MAYKNREGYADPTTGQAMGRIMREYRAQRRDTWKRQYELRSRPKVYVVSRYAGDIEKHVAAAVRCCRYAIRKGFMPVASHLMYPAILRDDVPEERVMGTQFGLALLAVCDEVWIFDDGTGMSDGMAAEESEARRLGKPIHYYSLEVIEGWT